MAGNWVAMNDFKNPPNKIIVPCRSIEHGEEIIQKIKETKPVKRSICKLHRK